MSEIEKTVKPNKNVRTSVQKEKYLVIQVDISKEIGISKSGRSNLVGTTCGEKQIPGTDIYINVNCYRKIPKDQRVKPVKATKAA